MMRLPCLAPRMVVSLLLSGAFLAAHELGAEAVQAAVAAALIAAMLVPLAHWAGIAGAAGAAGGATALWVSGAGGAAMVLAALPVAGNLALGWHFGATLRPGREALIARYTRAAHEGEVPAPLARYARGLTLAWTLFFLAFAGWGAVAMAGIGPTPATVATLNAALSTAFFLGEHPLRARLFPAFGPFGPWRTLRAIWRADVAGHAA